MDMTYSNLIADVLPILAEKQHTYEMLTERHLQAMWLEQKYFKNLKTSTGEEIEVLSPGIWNEEAGPDFLKAHLKIGGCDYRGDVEIHLTDDSWQQHGHHIDRRYNQVVFHLSLWHPRQEREIKSLSNTQHIFKAYLEDHLTISLNRIIQLIDLDLYPYRKFVGSGQCAHDLYKTLPEADIKELFRKASYHRLEQKYRRLKSIAERNELILGVGIAQALGYKHNAEAFWQLFLWLTTMNHLSELDLIACAVGSCGFFTEYYKNKWSHSTYYQNLWQRYAQMKYEFFPLYSLNLSQIRPFNHPIRRIVYLVKCLKDPHFFSYYEKLQNLWDNNWSLVKKQKDWTFFRLQLQEVVKSYDDEYWNSHYLFENEPQSEFLPLIGEDLKKEVIINTFMPQLFAEIKIKQNDFEQKAFQHFYATFPASKTGKSRYLVHRFFGDSVKGLLLSKADMVQGTYQLHHDFCTHFEASCEGCPFVERYKAMSYIKNLKNDKKSLANMPTYEFNSSCWI